MEQQLNGRFAQLFSDKMRERGVTMKQLAASSDYQYESFRKLARGITTPSPDMLRLLHEQIGLDIKQAELAITEDKARRRGMWRVVQQAAGIGPGLDKINQVWSDLTERDRDELIALAHMKAKANRDARSARRKTS